VLKNNNIDAQIKLEMKIFTSIFNSECHVLRDGVLLLLLNFI